MEAGARDPSESDPLLTYLHFPSTTYPRPRSFITQIGASSGPWPSTGSSPTSSARTTRPPPPGSPRPTVSVVHECLFLCMCPCVCVRADTSNPRGLDTHPPTSILPPRQMNAPTYPPMYTEGGAPGFYFFLLLVSFFWTLQVVGGVLNCTVAGAYQQYRRWVWWHVGVRVRVRCVSLPSNRVRNSVGRSGHQQPPAPITYTTSHPMHTPRRGGLLVVHPGGRPQERRLR